MADRLGSHFYTSPSGADQIITLKELRAIMLHTGGEILACGRLWKIKKEHLGGGVYRIYLELKRGK